MILWVEQAPYSHNEWNESKRVWVGKQESKQRGQIDGEREMGYLGGWRKRHKESQRGGKKNKYQEEKLRDEWKYRTKEGQTSERLFGWMKEMKEKEKKEWEREVSIWENR